MTEKMIKATPEKPKVVQKAKTPEKDKVKKENAFSRWWRETVGELRKVNWPTVPEARRLTMIVLAVMSFMAILLGVLDFVFSRMITLLLQ